MRFSQRHGHAPVREVVQRESIDDALRIGLWNAIDSLCWESVKGFRQTRTDDTTWQLMRRLWINLYAAPVDTLPNNLQQALRIVRDNFFDRQWFEVYDLLEFFVNEHPDERMRPRLASVFNIVLKREQAAYRIIEGRVAEITSEEEVAAIEEAVAVGNDISGVGTHLRAALAKLSDRQDPDYRNSIKESISAVESAVNHVTGGKTTLGQALKAVDPPLHPALREGFSKLYGYTSDAQGIRHALMEEPSLDFDDAKFMLVACSAFINYLVAKDASA